MTKRLKRSLHLTSAYIPPGVYNPGDKVVNTAEPILSELRFTVHKFSNRPQPGASRTVIIPAFSEFGCESLLPLYCIPQLMQRQYRGAYSIVIGWHGRDYLYRHLVDEYWELDESHQHLREYCRAFHHRSLNLRSLEKSLAGYGCLVSAQQIGHIVCYPKILRCIRQMDDRECGGRVSQFQFHQECSSCGFKYHAQGLFNDCRAARKAASWIPKPCEDKIAIARQRLPENAVGVTARARKCYGRNLPSDFYLKLTDMLLDMGYNPVWLGEKATCLPCPRNDILDISNSPESRDLEQTLAYVSRMKFTVQYWTASTRLAGLVGTPYILFESPDQIWGKGQEGMRLYLTTRGPSKLVISHFKNVVENQDMAINITKHAVRDIQSGNFSTVIGMVEDECVVNDMRRKRIADISWF